MENFDISGNATRGLRGEIERYHEFLKASECDLMMNYAAQQWATDLTFPLLASLPYRKILAPCGFSGLFDPGYASYFARMPGVMKRYDHLIFHSDSYRDIQYARQHGLSHYTVIPNGAAESEFGNTDTSFRGRYGVPDDLPLLLTVGSHTGIKGHALVINAFRRARIGRAVLVIIGNRTGGEGCLPDCRRRARIVKLLTFGCKEVLLLNPPREDVVAAYHAADLFVFGSNIECSPLVLFEAMAARTPFVTVACGNAVEVAKWSGGGIVIPTEHRADGSAAATPDTMARAIEQLILNPEERQCLGDAGYQAWMQGFSWEKIAIRYEELYQRVVDRIPSGSAARPG
jgi:glycosyltransferase involved in cell wall biosynthesis